MDLIDRAGRGLPRLELSVNGDLPTFREPLPASELQLGDPNADWLWHGFFAKHSVTLLSSYWKAGKTTLVAHLLKTFECGGVFCSRTVQPAKVLYVSEEPEGLWAARRDRLGIADHVHFQIRPFMLRATQLSWVALLQHIAGQIDAKGFDLVFVDPLTTLWPVEKENEAGLVAEALMPLRMLTEKAGVVLCHHFRKSGGDEATSSRGSGALPGFVDTIMELRRYDAAARKDRRRVLSSYGRFEETPEELVIELTEEGYVARGDRQEIAKKTLASVLPRVLPAEPPGWTWQAIKEALDRELGEDGPGPSNTRLMEILNDGFAAGDWTRAGEGRRGDPFRYWLTPL